MTCKRKVSDNFVMNVRSSEGRTRLKTSRPDRYGRTYHFEYDGEDEEN